MPNWCYNQEVIIGPEDEIRPLYNDLSKWTSEEYIENGFGTEWLGNIVARGINESREYENYACRGKIIDLFEPEKTDDGSEYKISFSSETAWAPMPGMWYALLKKRAPNCRYYYYAEEPGYLGRLRACYGPELLSGHLRDRRKRGGSRSRSGDLSRK